jgi:flagellar protein FliO/FliZ
MRFTTVILSALFCLTVRAHAVNLDKASDEAIMAAAEQLVSEGKIVKTEDVKEETPAPSAVSGTQSAVPVQASVSEEGKKESEIPVFTKSDKVAKSESNLIWRLVASMILLGVVATGLVVTSKRYARTKNKGGEKVRIEVLHQYQLGPKKSLALIRVAGEAMLIGCTDQAINMLKPVTLIDDELEGLLGKDFNGFLEDDFKIEDMRTALQSRPMER